MGEAHKAEWEKLFAEGIGICAALIVAQEQMSCSWEEEEHD